MTIPAILIGLVAALAVFPPPASSQETPDWRLEIIEAGWTFAGEGEGIVSFAKRDPNDPQVVHFRYEYRDGQFENIVPRMVEAMPAYGQMRSSTSVVEIDCDGRRRRPREETLYSGRNLGGEVLLTRVEDRPWTVVRSGTVGSQQIEWACPAQ